MRRARASLRRAIGVLSLLSASLSLAACGGGGVVVAGGGIGGTGITAGEVVAFGSVVVNGVEFKTDDNVGPAFVTTKFVNGTDSSGGRDNVVFRLGMVVIVRHSGGDNNAVEIHYDGNVEGPIDSRNPADNTIVVMGQPCVVDGLTRFYPDNVSFASLAHNNVVEASGFADNAGRIRATYIALKRAAPEAGETFKIRGYASTSGFVAGMFGLGPLPDVAVMTVNYSAVPAGNLPDGGLADGRFVEVRTTQRTVPGPVLVLDANSRVAGKNPEFEASEGAKVSFEGFPANIVATAQTFDLNGVRVTTSAGTEYVDSVPGGTRSGFTEVTAAVRLQAEGVITGGVLPAARIVFK